MSDPVTFNFDAPKHSVDLAAIETAIAAETPGPVYEGQPPAAPAAKAAPPQPPPAITQPEATEPAEASAPADAQTASPPQQEELKTYKIVVDGQEMEVTEADLKAGHMRHRDYTQKTQRVADRERELAAKEAQWLQEKAARDNELAQIDQFLRDQNALDAYMEKAFGVKRGQTVAPQIDPNKPLTQQDVAEIARYNAEQVRIAMQREVAEARQEALRAQQETQRLQQSSARASLEKEIDRHIVSVLDKFPTLKKFDGIEEDLIAEAARFKPSSVEEGKQRLSEAAERRMATIRAIADEEKKTAAAAAAKLKRTSTEPPGGAPPRQDAPRKLGLNTEDRKDFLKAAEEDLRAYLGQTS